MIIVRAPLRLPLGGGGTDLPSYYRRFGGSFTAGAIDKYLYVCANRPAADDLIRVKYSRYEEVSEVDDVVHDLVRPALHWAGVVKNIEIASLADVPAGTGLGSSSTYLVALLTALGQLTRRPLGRQDLAEASCHLEIDVAGHAAGKQDHYTAAFGGLNRYDIDRDGNVTISPLELDRDAVDRLNGSLLLFYTGVVRDADQILGAQRRDTEADDQTVLDSLHEVRAIGEEIEKALRKGDIDELGRLMHRHWEAKKRRSPLISGSAIDGWYELARSAGALGGKITGAGGGGFLVVCCPPGSQPAVRAALTGAGLAEMAYRFDMDGAKVLADV